MITSAADGVRDPFRDSSAEGREYGSSEGSTLNVGRNATLTLGMDSLIVLDEDTIERDASNCCGLIPSSKHLCIPHKNADMYLTQRHIGNKATRAIPFYNILWANINDYSTASEI
ncbi:hypothetical protein B0A49_12306, partial [Cryomyces minteri]